MTERNGPVPAETDPPSRASRLFSIENIILLPFITVILLSILALVLILYFTKYRNAPPGTILAALYSQRYAVLAGIVLMLIIVQTAVFVAYNISAPVRELSDICSRIAMSPGSANAPLPEIDPYTRRPDEIGQLAEAFSRMVDSLGQYTDELSLAKALNGSILENIPLGVMAFDRDQHEIFRNENASVMLSRTDSRDDAGRTLEDLILELIRKNDVLPAPAHMKNTEGKTREYLLGVWKLRGSGSSESNPESSPESSTESDYGTLLTIDDITYQRMIEEKVNQDEKLAYTGQLAADVAHEAKNPLAGIRAGLQALSPHLDAERDKKLCQGMIREVDRVTLLIENLVNRSRRRESEKTLVGIQDLFDELQLMYHKIAENKRIHLFFISVGDLWVLADELEIRQILINLINNSLKAMAGGGTLTVRAARSRKGVVLSVLDTGNGIDGEKLSQVLEGEGGGLGLSIVQRLVKQNGGQFTLTSEPGRGSEATVLLRGDIKHPHGTEVPETGPGEENAVRKPD